MTEAAGLPDAVGWDIFVPARQGYEVRTLKIWGWSTV